MGWQDAPYATDEDLAEFLGEQPPQQPSKQDTPRWMSAPLATDEELVEIMGEVPTRRPPQAPQQASQPSAEPEGFKLSRAGSIGARVAAETGHLLLLPLDAIQGVRNVISGTNYAHPSQHLDRLINKYTREPEGFLDKAAVFVGSTLFGGRGLRTVRPPTPPAPPVRPSFKQEARRVIAEGDKHDVPVYYDDVTRSTVAKQIGIGAEYIPLGTAPGRAVQAGKATTAMGRVAAAQAPAIDEQVPVLLQKNLQQQLARFKTIKDRMYKNAATLLDRHGKMKAPHYNRELSAVMFEVAKLNIPEQSKRNMLASLAPYTGMPPAKFSGVQQLSDEIGEAISGYYTGKNAVIGKRGVQYLQRIQRALKRDADEFAAFAGKSDPRAEKAWKSADHFYQTRIDPFKQAGFRDLVKTAEPEKVWQWLVANGGKHSRSQRMFELLDKDGRQAVRYGLLKNAYDEALGPHGVASPAKFAKYIEDHRPVIETYFKGKDLKELDGFVNLMRHVERAGSYAGEQLKPTGQRLMFLLLSTGAFFSVKTAATVGSTGIITERLFQTKKGRDFLIALSRSKPGSRSADTLTNALARYLVAGGVQINAHMREPAQEPEQTDLARIVPEPAPSGDEIQRRDPLANIVPEPAPSPPAPSRDEIARREIAGREIARRDPLANIVPEPAPAPTQSKRSQVSAGKHAPPSEAFVGGANRALRRLEKWMNDARTQAPASRAKPAPAPVAPAKPAKVPASRTKSAPAPVARAKPAKAPAARAKPAPAPAPRTKPAPAPVARAKAAPLDTARLSPERRRRAEAAVARLQAAPVENLRRYLEADFLHPQVRSMLEDIVARKEAAQ